MKGIIMKKNFAIPITSSNETPVKIVNTSNDFSFSLTWGYFGESSYDSSTGKLIKTNEATKPSDYITTLFLDCDQNKKIEKILTELDLTKYPALYDPKCMVEEPQTTLILSVHHGSIKHCVTCKNISSTYESEDIEGQTFLSACKQIIDFITLTYEWKALPNREFLYM